MDYGEFSEAEDATWYFVGELDKLREVHGNKVFQEFNIYKDKYPNYCYEFDKKQDFIDCMIERNNCAYEQVRSKYKNIKVEVNQNLVSKTIGNITFHDSYDEYGGKNE